MKVHHLFIYLFCFSPFGAVTQRQCYMVQCIDWRGASQAKKGQMLLILRQQLSIIYSQDVTIYSQMKPAH